MYACCRQEWGEVMCECDQHFSYTQMGPAPMWWHTELIQSHFLHTTSSHTGVVSSATPFSFIYTGMSQVLPFFFYSYIQGWVKCFPFFIHIWVNSLSSSTHKSRVRNEICTHLEFHSFIYSFSHYLFIYVWMEWILLPGRKDEFYAVRR